MYYASHNNAIAKNRTILDAALLTRGAEYIGETSRLEVTPEQLELASLGYSPDNDYQQRISLADYIEKGEIFPFVPGIKLETRIIEGEINNSGYVNWLDTPLEEEWIRVHDKKSGHNAFGAFKRLGIVSMRDVLVTGSEHISSGSGIGRTILSRLTEVVESNDADYVLEANPTPEYIATFCSTLDQVSINALGKYRFIYSDENKPRSINDVLVTPEEKLTEGLMLDSRPYYMGHVPVEDKQREIAKLHDRATIFAAKFKQIHLNAITEEMFQELDEYSANRYID